MSLLAEIEPKTRKPVMDLVREAGVDVSDWKNYKSGKTRPSANPKYCYSWSFIEPEKVVVLNLWHASLMERDGKVFQEINAREFARALARKSRTTVWQQRANAMAQAIETAARESLPVRVIICEGDMRQIQDGKSKASKVRHRMLDQLPWAVTDYDPQTGKCVIARGEIAARYVDQFSVVDTPQAAERRAVSGEVFVRSTEVRRKVLMRATGRCEWCRQPGFAMDGGRIYLETHHIVSLAAGGADDEVNVVALCANHHREAHYSARREFMLYSFSVGSRYRIPW